MRYLLDADTVSFVLRRHPRALERLKATPPSTIAISSITVMELEYGLALKPERRASIEPLLAALLENVHLLPYEAGDARATANVRAALRASGQPIGPYDLLLSGTALARGLILVTHNIREYQRVGGLRVEDWVM